ANQCKDNVDEMKKESNDAFLMVATCEDNIAKWRAEIKALKTKIAEEESRKEHFNKVATTISRARIEATTNEGLKCFGSA
ncbi:hypothetical protein A2U01_0093396, partial [Trifolium medium]|nr:hypothetical protein [Trifolium medium]